MAKALADEKILSYNDVVLRRSDIDILCGPYFLNDRIIEFYLSYLASCYPSEAISLIPPSIAFWITNCPDKESLKDFLGPLDLPSKKLVIFPVNNNDDVTTAEGGTHWSLLAFDRNANAFVHHDSSGGLNEIHAKRLYKAVVTHVGNSRGTYINCSCTPQQQNGYDCGLYVVAIARAICCWHETCGPSDENGLWFSTLKEQITPSAVTELREEILSLIRSLMKRQ